MSRTDKLRKRKIVSPGRVPVSRRPNKTHRPKKGPGSYKRNKRNKHGADESNSDAPYYH